MEKKKYIVIKGDTNDADYVTEKTEIKSDESLELIKKVAKVIKEQKIRHNWNVSEYGDEDESPYELYKDLLTQEEIERFDYYVPTGESGIHTIESIEILVVEEEYSLL